MTVHQFPKRPNAPKQQRPTKEPMLNVEDPAPFVLGLVLVLCYVGLLFAPVSFKNFVTQACILAVQNGQLAIEGRTLGAIPTLVTHGFVELSLVGVLMNAALIIAFGIVTIRGTRMKSYPVFGIRRGAAVFYAIFAAGIIGGGLAQWAYWLLFGTSGVMFGASAGVSALFAATAYAMGGRQYLMSFGILVLVMQVLALTMGSAPTWPAQLMGYSVGAVLAIRWVNPNSASMGSFR